MKRLRSMWLSIMMGYRTLEISSSCEIHIKEGQLEVTSDSGSILIPIEDLSQIFIWLQENPIIKKKQLV